MIYQVIRSCQPRGSIHTTIMELGPQNHNNGDGLLGPNSIIVVYMDPLGSGNHIIHYYTYLWSVGNGGMGVQV